MKVIVCRKKIIKIVRLLFVVIWVVIIFMLSSQPATQSHKLSTGIVSENINIVIIKTKFNIQSLDYIIRKNAHFFIYLILAMLVINLLIKSKISRYKPITLLVCVIYAISDEVHQAFIPGRTSSVKDVIIDISGAVVGMFIYLIFKRNFRTSKGFTCFKKGS